MQTSHSMLMLWFLQEQPQYNLFERTKVESDYVPLVSNAIIVDAFELMTFLLELQARNRDLKFACSWCHCVNAKVDECMCSMTGC